jgi:glycosyltransferase involved in cell wall biosynthesis
VNINYSQICVAVAVYNGEKTLEKTLNSLKNQTFNNLTILISDDCSSDNSREIINKFTEKFSNFHLIGNKENIGMFNNYNKLFRISNSKYFAWVDQDDYREISFFEKCFIELEKNDNSVMAIAHTGVKNKQNDELMHINTISSLANIKSVDLRYKRLIENYNDTTIYGLIRSTILKKTALWINMNGSANRLTFELSLYGEFVEVEELLTFYYGMGLAKRYNPDEEYLRATKKKIGILNLPFLILCYYQLKDLFFFNKISFFKRLKIFFYILSDFLLINFFKMFYRTIDILNNQKLNDLTFNFIDRYLDRNKDIINVVDKQKHPQFYPKHYPFKKIKRI